MSPSPFPPSHVVNGHFVLPCFHLSCPEVQTHSGHCAPGRAMAVLEGHLCRGDPAWLAKCV
jgi:hypothetical protein